MPSNSSELRAVWLNTVNKQWGHLHPSWELLFKNTRKNFPSLQSGSLMPSWFVQVYFSVPEQNTFWKHASNNDASLTEYIHLKQKIKARLLHPQTLLHKMKFYGRGWPTLTSLLLSVHCRSLCRWSCRDQDASVLPVWRYRQHSL